MPPPSCPRCGRPTVAVPPVWVCGPCREVVADTPVGTGSAVGGRVAALPAFLALPFREWDEEQNPVLKIHRLCDAVEVLVRFCVAVGLGEVRAGGALPNDVVAAFQAEIERPTLASWLKMLALLTERPEPAGGLVVPELPGFVRTALAVCFPRDPRPTADRSLLALRNLIAHGGGLSSAEARRLLDGSAPGEGWASRIEALLGELGFLRHVRVAVAVPEGDVTRELTPDGQLGDTLAPHPRMPGRSAHHIGLMLGRDGRWIELDPLCAFDRAVMPSRDGPLVALAAGPMLYFRADAIALSYAALGGAYPFGESPERLAGFRELFRLRRGDADAPLPADYREEMLRDAAAMVGRADEVRTAKATLLGVGRRIFWLPGEAGVGKSFFLARLARDLEGHGDRLRCVYWRFRAGDATRCNRTAFLRHAVTRLARWGPLSRLGVEPATNPTRLGEQLASLLGAVDGAPLAGGETPRVLFVIDGLDEIARVDPEFPGLPAELDRPGVVWLCAGRPDEVLARSFGLGRAAYLFPGGLPRMGREDIRGLLLDRSGRLKYDLLAKDLDAGEGAENPLVEAVVDRSAGLPLYVHFVVQDVLAGDLSYSDAHFGRRLPGSLARYFDKVLRDLRVGRLHQLITPLVATVVWAREPLDEGTLFALLVRRYAVDSLGTLRDGLRAVGSMVRPVPLPGDGTGYEPYHLSFRDHFRADAAGLLGDANTTARRALADAVADWRDAAVGSRTRRYLLRHGPAHLFDERRVASLVELARNREFLAAQSAGLPDEPDAPLKTLEYALRAAAGAGDAHTTAELCLRLHFRRFEGAPESPLQALRTVGLTRARALADLTGPTRADQWYLLLAWELGSTGRDGEARSLLTALGRRAGPLAPEASRILGWLPTPSPRELSTLLGQRLGEGHEGMFSDPADDEPPEVRYADVFGLAETTLDETEASALIDALEALDGGEPEAARQAAADLSSPALRAEVWARLADRHRSAGELDPAADCAREALALTGAVDAPELRARVFVAAARIAAARERPAGARERFRQALTVAQELQPDDPVRATIVNTVVDAQLDVGWADSAVATVAEVGELSPPDGTMRSLAERLGERGRIGEAVAAARCVLVGLDVSAGEMTERAHAVVRVVARLARDGEFVAARAAASLLFSDVRELASGVVAAELAAAGRAGPALATAESLTFSDVRAEAFAMIAFRLAASGNSAGALDARTRAREEFDACEDVAPFTLAVLAAADARVGCEDAPAAGRAVTAGVIEQHGAPLVRALCFAALGVAGGPSETDERAAYRSRAITELAGLPDAGRVECLVVLAGVQHRLGEDPAAVRETVAAAVAAVTGEEWLPWYEALALVAGCAAEVGLDDVAGDLITRVRDCRQLACERGHNRWGTLDRLTRRLADALAAAGDDEAALELIRYETGVVWCGFVRAAAAGTRRRRGEADAARELVVGAVRCCLPDAAEDESLAWLVVLDRAAAGDVAVAMLLWEVFDHRDPGGLVRALGACPDPARRAAGLRAMVKAGRDLATPAPDTAMAVAAGLLDVDDAPAARQVLAALSPAEASVSHVALADLHLRADNPDAVRNALAQDLATENRAEELLGLATRFERVGAVEAARATVELATTIDVATTINPWAVSEWAVARGDDLGAREATHAALRPEVHQSRLGVSPRQVILRAGALHAAGSLDLAVKAWFAAHNHTSSAWKDEIVPAVRQFLTSLPEDCRTELRAAVMRALNTPSRGTPGEFAAISPGLEGVLAWAGDVAGALEACRGLEGIYQTAAYEFLLDAPAVVADVATTREVIEQAETSVLKSVDLYGKYDLQLLIGAAYCRIGDREQGFSALDRAVETAAETEDWSCWVHAGMAAADVFAREGEAGRATELRHRVATMPMGLWSATRVHGTVELARYLWGIQDPSAPEMLARALRLTEDSGNAFVRGNTKLLFDGRLGKVLGGRLSNVSDLANAQSQTLADIVATQIQRGNLAAAAQTLKLINRPDHRSSLEAAIVRAYLARGEIEPALRQAEVIQDPMYRCRGLAAVAVGQARVGDAVAAAAALAAATAAAEAVHGFGYDFTEKNFMADNALRWLACADAELADFLGVEQRLAGISQSGYRNEALADIAVILAPTDPERALEYARRCDSLGGPPERALLAVRDAFVARGASDREARSRVGLPPVKVRALTSFLGSGTPVNPDALIARAEVADDDSAAQDLLYRASAAAADEPTFRNCLALARRLGVGPDSLATDFGTRAVGAGYAAAAAEYIIFGGVIRENIAAVVEGLVRGGEAQLLEAVLLAPTVEFGRPFQLCEGLARGCPEDSHRVAEVVARSDVIYFGG